MDTLLTPTTGLLHSFLDTSAFDTPRESWISVPVVGDPDVFSNAFGKHNVLQSPVLGRADVLSLPFEAHNNDRWSQGAQGDGAEFYITPPGTDKSNSETRHHSIDQEGNFELPSLPESVVFPILESDFFENSCPPQQIPNTDTRPAELPSKPKTRRTRKKKPPLTREAKEVKQQLFLERNRIAANNCRKRKKDQNENLLERCRVLAAENTLLRDLKADLISERRDLKEMMEGKMEDAGVREGENAEAEDEDVEILDAPYEEAVDTAVKEEFAEL